jgi:hypothetical protein
VLNRVRDLNFPKTVCGVVYEGWRSGPGCQFSFACDGSLARPPMLALYRDDLDIAEQALAGHVEAAAGLATHYHAVSVDPRWRDDLIKVAQIGSQIFYRWPGAAGRSGAFVGRYAGGERVPPEALLLARNLLSQRALPPPTLADPAASTASDTPTADVRADYRLGRRVKSAADVRWMNQWLEKNRPLTTENADPAP